MIGGNKTPFRATCAGAADVPIAVIKGPLPAPVDAYGNTTQMLDHCGNTIGAKARLYQQNTCGETICDFPACSDCPGGVDLILNTPEPPKVSENTFVHTGTVQLIPARKLGGKWIQAFKCWHGQHGFLTSGNTDCAMGTVLDDTKYLIREAHEDRYWNDYDDIRADAGRTAALSQTMTITAASGLRTLSGVVQTEIPSPYFASLGDFSASDFSAMSSNLSASPNCMNEAPVVEFFLGFCDTISRTPSGTTGSYNVVDGPQCSVVTTRTGSEYTWACHYAAGPPYAGDAYRSSGFIRLSGANTINDVLAAAATQADQWKLLDDKQHPFRTDAHTTVGPLVLVNEIETPVPTSAVFPTHVDDLENPIADADGNAPFAPGWTATYAQRDWFDPSAYQWVFPPGEDQSTAAATDLILLFDGSLRYAPLPAGYGQPVGGNPQGVFDKDHENWIRRNCVFGIGWTEAPESRGAFTPTFLPSNAQKWTDDFNATTLFPCAFVHADEGGIYLQKWAEIPIPRPSVNFARPYGPDKYLLDETAVFFMADNTAGVVTLKDTSFNTPTSLPFAADDIVGGASVGGFYVIDAIGTNTVTLGAKLLDVPAGWTTPSRDQSACFGRLRYPTCTGMDFIDQRAEIGGRVEVTAVNTIPATLTTATVQKYLSLDGPENCDIFDANMVLLANSVLTRIDDTHFTTTTGYASIATAKYITPHATKYKLADTRSKGDYVFRTWLLSLADSSLLAHSQIDACLAFSPCGPSIVTVTPNGETPPNGHRYDFPATINNGEVWLGQVQFWMIDPFWQQPHTPVAIPEATYIGGTDIIIWREDDGSCAADFTETGGGGEAIFHLFYALRPYVEARCTLPTIDGDVAPAPAGGVDITAIAGPVAQASIGDAEGPLINAISIPTPNWVIYAAEKACVDAAGRFANDYRANGT